MEDKIKFFGLEQKSTHHGQEYRYFSKYNSSKGSWCAIKKDALDQGEDHEKIILMLHGNNKINILKNP